MDRASSRIERPARHTGSPREKACEVKNYTVESLQVSREFRSERGGKFRSERGGKFRSEQGWKV